MKVPSLLCLLALLAAGCAAPASGPGDAARDDPTVVTRPDDASALAAASGDAGWHLHDYWGGETRRVAVNGEIQTGGWSCTGCAAIPMRFRGDRDMIVPLGTARLDVIVEWEANGETRHGQPELWVKPANASEPSPVAVLESGALLSFNTTNAQADPPHQVLSRWEFWVMLPSVDDEARFEGVVRVYAEAVRGLEIPPFPPHPDPWNGATEIQLFDVSNPVVVQQQNPEEGSRWCRVGCLGPHRPDDRVTVPYDAREVVVTLTHEPGLVVGLGLQAHGGDTWEMQPVAGERALPHVIVFRIPVTPETGDSPYANQSLWEFEAFIDQPTPEKTFVGGYRLHAVAVKE